MHILCNHKLLIRHSVHVTKLQVAVIHHGAPAPDRGAPVARLGRRAQEPAAVEGLALAPRDALGDVGVGLEPADHGLEVAPVGRHKDHVGLVSPDPDPVPPRRRDPGRRVRRQGDLFDCAASQIAAGSEQQRALHARQAVREQGPDEVARVLHPAQGRSEDDAGAELVKGHAPRVRHPFGVDDVAVAAKVGDGQGVAGVAAVGARPLERLDVE